MLETCLKYNLFYHFLTDFTFSEFKRNWTWMSSKCEQWFLYKLKWPSLLLLTISYWQPIFFLFLLISTSSWVTKLTRKTSESKRINKFHVSKLHIQLLCEFCGINSDYNIINSSSLPSAYHVPGILVLSTDHSDIFSVKQLPVKLR